MKELLLVSPRASGIGGVAQHVARLRRELEARGFEVDVLSVENTTHIPVKGLYNPSFALSSALKSLLRSLGGRKYDVAHGHNVPSWPAIRLARAEARVLTQHGVYSRQIGLLHGRLFGKLSGWLESKAVRSVDALTCVSRSVCEFYRSRGVDAVYIPNAVDLREIPSEGLKIYEKQVVYVGRLSREKGFDVLLEAAGMLNPDVHLIVVGSGVRELEERARALSKRLRNFHYLGYRPRGEALRVIKGSDLLVLPSRAEGLPTVLLEAMASKTPILASRIPGILDVVDETCAILIEPGDPRELAKAINRSVMEYPKTFVERAFEKVMKEFSWDKVAQEYIELYERLLSS
ncbi:MAG: glycosyltransferase family 4 protein [Thermofilum sp.]